MYTIDVTDFVPTNNPHHIAQVLAAKHRGREVTVHYRAGGDVVYSVR